MKIGRGPQLEINGETLRLNSPFVSKNHATLMHGADDKLLVIDHKVNGEFLLGGSLLAKIKVES